MYNDFFLEHFYKKKMSVVTKKTTEGGESEPK